jgi:leucyl/phenylalanyl-tRNA--protein transferase
MMVPVLSPGDPFPPTETALKDPDGLLAMGGDLTSETLIRAYSEGIFPWFSGEQPILWWSPNPRLILLPENLKISRSLSKTLRKKNFEVTVNTAFIDVIEKCARDRKGDSGSWITEEMVKAYTELFHLGLATSVETWLNGRLVGGLYGVSMGRVFFGESMFSSASDASKVALTHLLQTSHLKSIELIDCQVYSSHLVSLGAEMISRKTFEAMLHDLIKYPKNEDTHQPSSNLS